MGKELCVVHANCQGEPLLDRLRACAGFDARYECVLFTNYVREPVPDEVLAGCSLFLYQHLGPGWDELASDRLLSKLGPNARALCLPNMFFKGYWPLWSGEPGFDYRCAHLEEFISLDLPPEETVMLFLRAEVGRTHDLDALFARSVEVERQREAHTPVKYVDLILEHWRERRLFNTINHPGAMLMNHAANGVLRELGFDPVDGTSLEALGEPFPEFEQPVNPKVAEHHGLAFGGPDQEYFVYGRRLTFARYVANYIIARQAGVTDFIGFLQGDQIAI